MPMKLKSGRQVYKPTTSKAGLQRSNSVNVPESDGSGHAGADCNGAAGVAAGWLIFLLIWIGKSTSTSPIMATFHGQTTAS